MSSAVCGYEDGWAVGGQTDGHVVGQEGGCQTLVHCPWCHLVQDGLAQGNPCAVLPTIVLSIIKIENDYIFKSLLYLSNEVLCFLFLILQS